MTGRASGNGPGPRDAIPPGSRSPAPPGGDPPPDPPPTPGNGPFRRTVRVINPLGLHHRVADRFAKTAKQYQSAVTVWNGDARADGKSLWDLILLVVLPGSEVVLEVAGPDAQAAVEPLAEILAAPGGEDYTI
jgi:phosphotransferase system HPr (HPr) family protein